MSKALEDHLAEVKQAGLLVTQDGDSVVLVSLREGRPHKVEILPFARSQEVGLAVLQQLHEVTR